MGVRNRALAIFGVDLPHVLTLGPRIKGGHLVDRHHIDDGTVHYSVRRRYGEGRFTTTQWVSEGSVGSGLLGEGFLGQVT